MKTLTLFILALGISAQAAHAAIVKYDDHIASQIHLINQMEMKMGQLAQEKGTTADVRQFGERIYNDHRTADDRLMKIAANQHLTITAPSPRNAMERKQHADTQDLMRKLQNTAGKEFDQAFLKGMYEGHKQVIAMMTAEQKKLGMGRSELNEFVQNTLIPNLHQHLDIARSIENRYYA